MLVIRNIADLFEKKNERDSEKSSVSQSEYFEELWKAVTMTLF